ncbi:MOB kinase activator-like 2 [Orchesella cincta]|uniref:MOB kinase activator-like 2 n=1 Tax=Orchesella cincta TaxID=48709 RepID=A0A1D2M1N6_ORCCI|nr:MOB kinase activator-like 2 [Orchesella cincta]
MATQVIPLFENVNEICCTVSEFCTSSSCPDMNGPGMRLYPWYDEKGKKAKVSAPQYIDYVMTFIQNTIHDETMFPTKAASSFPSSFAIIVKKICELLFHVMAHLYENHFKEIVLLSLHAHLNCVFAHFVIFNENFQLVKKHETEILQDLAVAIKQNVSPR